MKRFKSYFFAIAALFIFLYLIGSFCAVSFDIGKWDEAGRVILAIIFFISTPFVILAVIVKDEL